MSHQTGSFLDHVCLSRRAALGGAGAALALSRIKVAKAAVGFPQRLLVLFMPGGLDGLSTVIPYGDPNLSGLRAPLLPPAVGQANGMFDLGGFFGLHPALKNFYALYQANQLLPVHAVSNILLTRSHFQGQDVLQYGTGDSITTGWVNRLVGLLPTIAGGVEAGVNLGANMPIGLQGPAPIGAYSPSSLTPTANTLAALVETVGAPDPLIGYPTESGFADRMNFQTWLKGINGGSSSLQIAMRNAGTFLAAPGGPAVAMVTTPSADTHAGQVSALNSWLADLDAGMGLFVNACGSAWANTVVLTMTEFGRTAYMNGTTGTDHGTALAMFLAGGAVQGGKVLATWPGLASSQLYQGRDLAPTVDIRSIIMGVLRDHMGLGANALATVFPDATGISPQGGLVSG